MSLSPSPPLAPRTSPTTEFPTEVQVSGVVELGEDDEVVQSPAKQRTDENAVSDSAVVFRSPLEKPRQGKRRPLRGLRQAHKPTPVATPPPRLMIDTNLANAEERETPIGGGQHRHEEEEGGGDVRRQAEMFSLDDTGGHLRLSRLSKEGLDSTTVIVAEKDVSWIGESPEQTDTEDGSDSDKPPGGAGEERSPAAAARSPAGRHFHVWGGAAAMSSSAMVKGPGNRKGRRGGLEDRKQRKGRVVEQFRNAVDEHRRAKAKRQVGGRRVLLYTSPRNLMARENSEVLLLLTGSAG
ncbi:hypothetical protein FOL47_010127 [Perkinsus chesapeaki]|uniref:Uncharacterized protein n=1 Tax=Perkinsus chesapeaki TaxID=330153 RepID=A0A7J6MQY2_PERCH|nr:hypothetical protein FOL47_010127 [Perkinsus chesapeaki]